MTFVFVWLAISGLGAASSAWLVADAAHDRRAILASSRNGALRLVAGINYWREVVRVTTWTLFFCAGLIALTPLAYAAALPLIAGCTLVLSSGLLELRDRRRLRRVV